MPQENKSAEAVLANYMYQGGEPTSRPRADSG